MAVYVNNKEFHRYLLDYKNTGNRKSYNEIGKIFLLIAQRLLNKSCFINYSDDRKEEMIGNAVLRMCKNINGFDLEKRDPFAFFTTVATNEVYQFINNQNERDRVFTSFANDQYEDLQNRINEGDYN